jgi:hypothetical protein
MRQEAERSRAEQASSNRRLEARDPGGSRSAARPSGPAASRTALSTMPGKHAKASNNTELPRRPLLTALEAESELRNTSNAKQMKPSDLRLTIVV